MILNDIKIVLWKAWRWLWKHWLGLLIAYLLVGFLVYLTIWAFVEPLGMPDILDIIPDIVLVSLLISSNLVLLLELFFRYKTWKSYRVTYEAHIQGPGWQEWVSDGAVAGTTKEGRRMEAIRIKLGPEIAPGIGIEYQTHLEGIGWQDWVSDGVMSGTTGVKKRMEAIRIKLTKETKGYEIFYQSYVEGIGWQNWVSDGVMSGTTGVEKRMEAIRIFLVIPPQQEDMKYFIKRLM